MPKAVDTAKQDNGTQEKKHHMLKLKSRSFKASPFRSIVNNISDDTSVVLTLVSEKPCVSSFPETFSLDSHAYLALSRSSTSQVLNSSLSDSSATQRAVTRWIDEIWAARVLRRVARLCFRCLFDMGGTNVLTRVHLVLTIWLFSSSSSAYKDGFDKLNMDPVDGCGDTFGRQVPSQGMAALRTITGKSALRHLTESA